MVQRIKVYDRSKLKCKNKEKKHKLVQKQALRGKMIGR